MIANSNQYSGGSGTNPSASARGEIVSKAPTVTITIEVTMSGQLAQLWRNGILLVRMT
jgi:hypothetical protein